MKSNTPITRTRFVSETQKPCAIGMCFSRGGCW